MNASLVASRPSLAFRRAARSTTARVQAAFNFGKPATKSKSVVRETVIPEPDYKLPAAFLGLAGLTYFGAHNTEVAGLLGVLGVFLGIQASRVKFVFDDEGLEVLVGERMEESENAFVGGRNRWSYDSFVNWEMWWPAFPVLIYFKETQTKPEGQIHFFPVIFNGQQLYNVMKERCKSINPKP